MKIILDSFPGNEWIKGLNIAVCYSRKRDIWKYYTEIDGRLCDYKEFDILWKIFKKDIHSEK